MVQILTGKDFPDEAEVDLWRLNMFVIAISKALDEDMSKMAQLSIHHQSNLLRSHFFKPSKVIEKQRHCFKPHDAFL
jgi:hypothetical protein